MSKEVDERVVEMRFDNAKFEKNTRQTMKTLQELNESLKLGCRKRLREDRRRIGQGGL